MTRVVLMNPGPVNVDERVRAAIASPDECHREPETRELLTRVRGKLTAVAGGDGHTAVLLTGSGTAALEATVSSVVPATGGLLVLDNGHYGERLHRIAEVHGIAARRLEFGWANPVDLDAVDRALAAEPWLSHVAMVHHETSTGMLNPAGGVGRLAARHGRSFILDAISSIGAEDLDVVADHVDWCVGTANKCLEGLPGISFVLGTHAAFDALAEIPARTFYLDLHAGYRAQVTGGAPQFTPALQVLRAFDVALELTLAETVASRGARYRARAEQIRTGLTGRGVRLLLPPQHRAASITNAWLGGDLTYDQLHDGLRQHGFVIYAVQDRAAGSFRLANMGQLTAADIDRFFIAFDAVTARPAVTALGVAQ
ncbi:aminotransferase class V-fold PLP-dependent enzyme [Dactylosporangium sp. NPDC000555]|uniref:pyridoxal-phosphate-dependent aminotransferase family protein n=1 Tax=Dactylosporangium sp. NPDC000555 TaxID=3154260 RepID=UPI003319F6EA